VAPFELPAHYNRKATRSMGRVARDGRSRQRTGADRMPACLATRCSAAAAWASLWFIGGHACRHRRFWPHDQDKTTEGINANTYIKMMSHTAAVNIGVFFGITGRIITT
jgi:3-oxoacyl-[acyl-carrier-protein] synthase II